MSESNTENNAQSPEHPDADIIIRSSDGVGYRAHTLLLRLASPIFQDMFALPRSPGADEAKDGLPIVQLAENSRTIQMLLSYCYPAVYGDLEAGIKELSEIDMLLGVTEKYEMEMVHKVAIQLLRNPQFLEKEPLRVYAIACRYQLHSEAILAARYTLQYPLLEDKYIAELELIDAEKLYRVLVYHKKCGEAAAAVAKDHTWITNEYAFFNCPGVSKNPSGLVHSTNIMITPMFSRVARSQTHRPAISMVTVTVHHWWMEYMERTGMKLRSDVRGQTVRDFGIANDAFAAAGTCASCSPKDIKDFRKFIDSYAEEVEKKISKVRFELDF